MIKTTCTKITLRSDDLREYEKAKLSWEKELKQLNEPQDVVQSSDAKQSKSSSINRRIGITK